MNTITPFSCEHRNKTNWVVPWIRLFKVQLLLLETNPARYWCIIGQTVLCVPCYFVATINQKVFDDRHLPTMIKVSLGFWFTFCWLKKLVDKTSRLFAARIQVKTHSTPRTKVREETMMDGSRQFLLSSSHQKFRVEWSSLSSRLPIPTLGFKASEHKSREKVI